MYRQDLKGFGEPQEGQWDGFQRVNTDTRSGGIVGVFRQGGREEKRQVIVTYLDPLGDYTICKAPAGIELGSMKGKDLLEKGFEVELSREYDGALYEIRITR
jgi:alpha-galactosidase